MKKKNYESPQVGPDYLFQPAVLCSSADIETLHENEYTGGNSWEEIL